MAISATRRLAVEHLPLTGLKADPRNPRVHKTRQVRQIADSIKAFGFNVPVLIDSDDCILTGHGRVLAAQKLGLTEVPIVRLDHMSPAQARAFAIADNRLTEVATWDDQLLGEILGELAALELDFSLEATGFSITEIDLRIEGLADNSRTTPDPADLIPHAPAGAPICQVGDLWLLDRHRLLCGDATQPACYEALTQGVLARMVFADPPYNVPINGHVSGNGAIRHREFAMASGEMTDEQFTDFLTKSLSLMARSSLQGSLHYICIDWRHQPALLKAGKHAYTEQKNLCVWLKSQAGMGSFYRSQHELIHVYKNGAGPHRNNIELGRHGRDRSNVWTYPGINGFGRHGEEGDLLALHPTVKPVAMIADAILDCTARGEIVLDPFLGSGSTLIAAQRVGRGCYGMELDPLYVDTAIRRWQRITGEAATHAGTGERFDDRAAPAEAAHG